MSTDILDDIDRAISDCGVSGDAMRWTPDPVAQRDPTPAEVIAAMREVCRRFAEAFRAVVAAMRAANEQLIAAGIVVPPSPIDPREHALDVRRNRNTGPQAALRAPRRIDPKGMRG